MTEEKVVELSVKQCLDYLTKRGLIREVKNSYTNVENLLYNYNSLRESINENKKEIKELKLHGLPERSKSITSIPNGGIIKDNLSKIDDKISNLKQANTITQCVLNKIDRLILKYENPKYKGMIKNFYFGGYRSQTNEDLAVAYECDEGTIRYQKNLFINKIKVILFPNNIINELGY